MPAGDMVTALRDHRYRAIDGPPALHLEAETKLGARRAVDVCSGVDRQY